MLMFNAMPNLPFRGPASPTYPPYTVAQAISWLRGQGTSSLGPLPPDIDHCEDYNSLQSSYLK